MSGHWRLAVRYAAWVSAGAILAGGAVWFFYGGAHAGALLYGAGVGIASFVSTALTVSLLAGRSAAVGVMIGAASFVMRCGFAAAVLGVPAYLELWPAIPMLGGFAGVYLAENLALLPGVPKVMSDPNARRSAREGVERRAEA